MTTPEATSQNRVSQDRVSEDQIETSTFRSWELELLISGAVLFALLQIPGRLTTAFERFVFNTGQEMTSTIASGYFYLLLIVSVMIGTLILHLFARAYWVGLIGLRSVFPRGIRWRGLDTYGPRGEIFYRASQPSLGRLIEGTNAFCSSLFSVASALTILFFISIVFFLTMVTLTQFAILPQYLLYILAALIFLPPMVLTTIDKKIPRKERGDRLERIMRFALRPYNVLLGVPIVNPIMMTFRSNIGKKTFYALYSLVFFMIFGMMFLVLIMIAGALQINDLVYFPRVTSERIIVANHYEDQRSPEEQSRLPSIPSEVITGPYLRLFLPYIPTRHNELIAERCPDLEPLAKGGISFSLRPRFRPVDVEVLAAHTESLQCLASIYEVRLNGETLSDLDPSFYRNRQSGVHGLLMHLPISDLEAGKHVLRINTPPVEDSEEKGDDEEESNVREYVIPFWI